MISIVAVVPANSVDAMARRGWRVGRSNGFTATMERSFEAETEALVTARKLPRSVVWNMEGNERK